MAGLAAAFPGVRVYVAETAYAAAGSAAPEPGYPATDAGQLSFVRAVRAAAAASLGEQNGGVLWGEGGESSWTSLRGSGYAPDIS